LLAAAKAALAYTPALVAVKLAVFAKLNALIASKPAVITDEDAEFATLKAAFACELTVEINPLATLSEAAVSAIDNSLI
jgi:hypothetical protein